MLGKVGTVEEITSYATYDLINLLELHRPL